MCNWRGFGMVGKAASRKSPPPPMLTCSPAGQHILSNSVGLTGRTQPYCPPTALTLALIWAAGVGVSLVVVLGGGGEDRQAFSVESHFPVVSSSCVFQVLSLQMRVFFLKGEEKALNISTCGTSVTWLFPFQTLDLCLPATTQEEEGVGGRKMWSEWKCWGWRRRLR